MAFETATYLVTKEIAIRSGLIESRYRIKDGRFVLNNRDLSRVRFTIDEYINGLSGVEKVSAEEAKTLIRQNNFSLGYIPSHEENEQQEINNDKNKNSAVDKNDKTQTETENVDNENFQAEQINKETEEAEK